MGQELYKKEITCIAVASQEQLNLTETFVFNPSETGIFKLEYAYDDETFSDNLHFSEAQVLYYWPLLIGGSLFARGEDENPGGKTKPGKML